MPRSVVDAPAYECPPFLMVRRRLRAFASRTTAYTWAVLRDCTTAAGRAHQTRCIIHIADAPPHGRTLHDLGDEFDSYATPGSEPHGLTHQSLLPRMVSLRINYALLRINCSTDELPVFVEEMRCQSLAKSFALEFNSLLCGEHTIDFVTTACFKGCSSSADAASCISLEPFLEGNYVKYNGNAGYVDDKDDSPANQEAQAFSHFTFERSKGRFLVCELQGVGEFLTDPAVHTADENRFRLSRTNLGFEGMKLFFMSHECNDECRRLGLRSSKLILKSDTPVFREMWPPMADTVCCSNMMCERILRRDEANPLERYPGCHWCDVCLPQLEAFMVKWVCAEDGPPDHDFEVSRFFYESQGVPVPRKCQRHREGGAVTATRDEIGAFGVVSFRGTMPKPKPARAMASTMVAGALWDRLRSATVK